VVGDQLCALPAMKDVVASSATNLHLPGIEQLATLDALEGLPGLLVDGERIQVGHLAVNHRSAVKNFRLLRFSFDTMCRLFQSKLPAL